MSFSKIPRQLKDYNNTTNDIILSILAEQHPLSMKKLYIIAKRDYAFHASYQALHKSCQYLLLNNIIIRKGMDYEINMSWVKYLEEFAKELRGTYKNPPKEENEQKTMTFYTLASLDNYSIELSKHLMEQMDEGEIAYGELRHAWWPLFNSSEVYDRSKQSKIFSKVHLILSSDSPVDRWIAQYMRTLGMEVKTNCSCAKQCDIFIYKDTIVQTFLTQELNDLLDKHITGASCLEDINMKLFFEEVFDSKHKIELVITKNKRLAELLKNNIYEKLHEKDDTRKQD
ncbi:hypothetical protein H6501_02650 [Candidatus Woesearchaeota archaeon]|nr:hypothetical protein [Candidatus Woesearchaeota archaeon]USN43549.1 MAG: hypothetical protein H6500_04095 [Candidatus Woesearchaeota archaeon]